MVQDGETEFSLFDPAGPVWDAFLAARDRAGVESTSPSGQMLCLFEYKIRVLEAFSNATFNMFSGTARVEYANLLATAMAQLKREFAGVSGIVVAGGVANAAIIARS